MEAAVFDKDFAGVISANHDTGKIQAGNVALERLLIESGLVGFGIEPYTEAAQEREIGMVAGERKYLHGREDTLPFGSADVDCTGLETQDLRYRTSPEFGPL